MAHFFHAIAAALEANVWFEYVPSAANIADLPSRGEFGKLVELGSVWFASVLPDLGLSWSASFASAFMMYAPRSGKASLRYQREIRQAIERLSALRRS